MYIKDRLRRSMMFVPGNNPGMIRDALIYGADSIMFDLEDSVAYTEKDAARLLVNRVMHLGVWDYSAALFNLLGQICLPFTLLWFPLCGIGILLDRGMRRALFGTQAPQLRWV